MTITGLKISKTLLAMMLISAVATGSVYAENVTMDRAQSDAKGVGQKVDSSMNKVGNFMDDSTITAKMKTTLMDHENVKSTDISVKTDQKVMALSGFVESQAQVKEAVKMTKDVEGVTSASDKLCVHDSENTSVKGYADDMAITSEVKAKLLTDDTVPSRKVKVETADGVVQFSGTVDPQAQSDRVESIVKAIDDVKSVKDDLKTR